MNRLYTTVLSFAISLSVGVAAQEASEAVLDLSSRDIFDQCTQTSLKYDHSDYDAWTFNNYQKYPYMYNYNITAPYYSDYLISPEVTLKAYTLYRIETSPAAYNSGKTTSLTIGIGQGADVSKYTVVGQFNDIPYSYRSSVEQKTLEFHVDADGQYKIYFLGEGNPMYLYDTRIVEVGSSSVPLAVSDLTLMPASDGSAVATIGFTLPTATISGHPLEGSTLKYSIYRGEEEAAIKTGSGTAGDFVTYTDEEAGTGAITYAVVVESDGNLSDRVSASTYVGKETPTAVADLTVSKAEEGYTLTWTAPAAGVHGALIDPAALTYKVSRIVDGEATVVAEACAETTFTDNYSSADLHSLQYSVVAVLNGEESEEALTNAFTVGFVTLPFADSFAGASFGKMWSTEIVSGRFDWTAVESTSTQKPIVAESVDKDGGFAFYNSWSATRGCSARLITAPIKYVAGTTPLVEFYIYRTTGNDQIKLEVSCDNGDWVDVPDAVVTLKGDVQDWDKVSFPIAAAIAEGCDTYRVSLTAVSSYNQNTVLDNLRIFVPAEKDLEAAAPVAPESVFSGNNINVSFTILNNSTNAVSADDYSLELVTDYPNEIALPATTDIEALGSATVEIAVPVTAIEAKAAETYSFALKVVFEGDENLDNNTSATATVGVGFVEEAAPSNPTAEQFEDNSIEVKWKAAGEVREPVNAGTSFEGFENGFTGPFDGFTAIDLDEAAGDNYYITSGSAFHIVNKPQVPSGRDGDNVIGLTLGANKQQNDWLISPALDCKEGSTMDLSFLIATKKFSSSSNYYTMEILYSTTDEYDAADPSAAFGNKVQTLTSSLNYGQFINSETFVPISITGIPAETKRIAIHFASKISYTSAMWIDNIRITENETNPMLGYNVYEDGVGRVNAEVIAPTETSLLIPETEIAVGRYFFVTAVYGNGESQPSELTPDIISAVVDIDNGGMAVITTAEGLVVTGAENATVYDLQGRVVARPTNGAAVRLTRGVYIVKAGNEVRKVAVSR